MGAFIEESYWRRFGGPHEREVPGEPGPLARKPRTAHTTEPTPVRTPAQAQALVCYLLYVADDLQRWLAHASDFDADVLSPPDARRIVSAT